MFCNSECLFLKQQGMIDLCGFSDDDCGPKMIKIHQNLSNKRDSLQDLKAVLSKLTDSVTVGFISSKDAVSDTITNPMLRDT